jgi:predicted AlkP superfamily phosphohydrolase/phosphomutase
MASPRTVVVGLDGAHFELLRPWIDDGQLPNIARAIDTGVTADLEAVLPPVTAPNWKAYSTGLNPGKFGIYWWENIDVDAEKVYFPAGRTTIPTEFWEYIGDSDPVGVLGIPTTYPPSPVDGFVVAGAPDAEDTGYTYPPELEGELEDRFDYRVTKRHRLAVNPAAAAEEILDLIERRFTVGRALADAYDVEFLQLTTFYLNSLHHFRWDDRVTLRAWQIVDDHVGELLDADTNLMLMSDHGSTEITTVFNINTWLEANGYLDTTTTVSQQLARAGVTTDRLIRLAYTLRVPELAESLVPDRLLDVIPDDTGGLTRESKTTAIDWATSTAVASGQGPLYATLDPDSPRYDRVLTELRDRLEGLTDPAGRPVATRVLSGEAVYDGRYTDDAPDLVIDQAAGVHIDGAIGRPDVFTTPDRHGWRAENKRDGLFVATGPDFATADHDRLSILDLAPLFLHLHDCAIPADLDGTVPTRVFDDDSEPATRRVRRRTDTAPRRERRRIRAIARRADL